MAFHLLPTIDLMLGLYQKPIGQERFEEYLRLLKGNSKDDLELPISGYNPMAKPQVVEQLIYLKQLGAEEILAKTLLKLDSIQNENPDSIGVALNLSDDLMGGWTNRFTADFDNRFKQQAFVRRNLVAVNLWTSESHTLELIEQRTKEACFRTIYRSTHPVMQTLEDHIRQEQFAARSTQPTTRLQPHLLEQLDDYYRLHHESEDYHRIFNFLYGDVASASLGFPAFGIPENGGWEWVKLRS